MNTCSRSVCSPCPAGFANGCGLAGVFTISSQAMRSLAHAHDLVGGQVLEMPPAHGRRRASGFEANARLAAHTGRQYPWGQVLCEARLIRSTGSVARSIVQFAGARAASGHGRRLFTAERTNGRMSWITPISLFTNITLMRIVSGRIAALERVQIQQAVFRTFR